MVTPRDPSTPLRSARDDSCFIISTTQNPPAQLRESARDHPDTEGSADPWSDQKASSECGRSGSIHRENATDKFPFVRRRCQPNREEFLCVARRDAVSPNFSAT